MDLTKEEKQILTLLNDTPVKDFLDYAQGYINLKRGNIKRIVDKFLNWRFIEILKLKNKNDLWYFHTDKVKEDMIDTSLDYRLKFGSNPPILNAHEKLEKKIKN